MKTPNNTLLAGDTVEVTKQGPHDGITGEIITRDNTSVTIETPTGDSLTFLLEEIRRVKTPCSEVDLKECPDSDL